MTTVRYCTDRLVYACDGCSLSGGWRSFPGVQGSMEVPWAAPVETPGRTETVGPMLQHWGGGWALHCRTDPAQHCRSRSHRTEPGSKHRRGKLFSHVTNNKRELVIFKEIEESLSLARLSKKNVHVIGFTFNVYCEGLMKVQSVFGHVTHSILINVDGWDSSKCVMLAQDPFL